MKIRHATTIRCIAVGIVVLHCGLLMYSASVHSPTWDEVAHVPAGLSHWQFDSFDLYRVNPPLVRMWATAPLLLTDAPRGLVALHSNAPYARWEFYLGGEFLNRHG